jgi:hypothetical protein
LNYSPNLLLEALWMLLTIAGWWVLFYVRHRPASKLRRIALLVSFPVCYIVFMVIPLGNVGNEILWVSILLLFALLCGEESRIFDSLFTAIYYIGIEACMDSIRNFIVRYTIGRNFPAYSIAYYVHFNLLYLVVLGWALFYYWVLKDRRGQLPLHFWIITVIPPLGSAVLLTRFANTARPLLEMGVNIYLEGILTGVFLLALTLCTFYMYVRLLAYLESHEQPQVLQGQLTAYARRITLIEAFQRQTAEMRHDLKNIMFTLNIDMEQQNYAQAKQRIAELQGHLKQVEPESYTGVALIDAVISYKAAGLRELGAVLGVQADLLDIGAPLAYDIASIMGTALDNVTDACELLHAADRTARAAVHCKIQKQKNLLLIQVTNPLPAPLRYENGEIQTTKTESGHGLGLPALRRIVQKYAGDVVISDSGKVFSLSVMLFV